MGGGEKIEKFGTWGDVYHLFKGGSSKKDTVKKDTVRGVEMIPR